MTIACGVDGLYFGLMSVTTRLTLGALFPSLTNGETNSLFDCRGVELTVGFIAKDAGVGQLTFPIISS